MRNIQLLYGHIIIIKDVKHCMGQIHIIVDTLQFY